MRPRDLFACSFATLCRISPRAALWQVPIKIWLCTAVIGLCFVFLASRPSLAPPAPVFSPAEISLHISEIFSHLPLPRIPSHKKYAIVTLNSEPNKPTYHRAQLVLAFSITKHLSRDDVDLVYLYFNGTLNDQARAELAQVGWQYFLQVDKIMPLRQSYVSHFRALFSKLWTLTLEQYETVLYLDSDTLVTTDIGELFWAKRLPSIFFAASRDNMFGKWVSDINAGVLLVHPNTTVFKILITTAAEDYDKWDPDSSEQSFLNYYVTTKCPSCLKRLPMDYNANTVIHQHYPDLWAGMANSIVHYAIDKPFLYNPKWCPDPKQKRQLSGPVHMWLDMEEEMTQRFWPEKMRSQT